MWGGEAFFFEPTSPSQGFDNPCRRHAPVRGRQKTAVRALHLRLGFKKPLFVLTPSKRRRHVPAALPRSCPAPRRPSVAGGVELYSRAPDTSPGIVRGARRVRLAVPCSTLASHPPGSQPPRPGRGIDHLRIPLPMP